MAFFKFQKSGDEPPNTQFQPESVEGMRKRAKYRLIGAAVLVLIGVIGLPMLFDKQPRPISVDTPIEIPDKNKARPLSIPAPAAVEVEKSEVTASAVAQKNEEILPSPPVDHAPVAPKTGATKEVKVVEKSLEKPIEKPAPVAKPAPKIDEGAKAQALLDGKSVEKKAETSEGRFVVQVGAFSDNARAQEVRLKVEHAGLKTYTHVAQTKEGSRIRVRVGPFATKAEADKAAEKIKKLALPAAILTL